jgi:hypothetical protein
MTCPGREGDKAVLERLVRCGIADGSLYSETEEAKRAAGEGLGL